VGVVGVSVGVTVGSGVGVRVGVGVVGVSVGVTVGVRVGVGVVGVAVGVRVGVGVVGVAVGVRVGVGVVGTSVGVGSCAKANEQLRATSATATSDRKAADRLRFPWMCGVMGSPLLGESGMKSRKFRAGFLAAPEINRCTTTLLSRSPAPGGEVRDGICVSLARKKSKQTGEMELLGVCRCGPRGYADPVFQGPHRGHAAIGFAQPFLRNERRVKPCPFSWI
jgi:hypothetical protein